MEEKLLFVYISHTSHLILSLTLPENTARLNHPLLNVKFKCLPSKRDYEIYFDLCERLGLEQDICFDTF